MRTFGTKILAKWGSKSGNLGVEFTSAGKLGTFRPFQHSNLSMARRIWTYQELIDSGKTKRQIESLVREQKLTRIFRGVYISGEVTGDLVWWALKPRRKNIALDGYSAIQSHLNQHLTLPILIRVPTSSKSNLTDAYVRQVRSTRMPHGQRVNFIDAIATCLDHNYFRGSSYLHQIVEEYYSGDYGAQNLKKHLAEIGGRDGTKLADFLAVATPGSDSELELILVRLLQRLGFKTEQNTKIGGYKWDVCIRDLWVLIDIDSWKYHGGDNRTQFVLDRWKSNHAAAMGWTALRLTDSCVVYDQVEIVDFLNRIREFRKKAPNGRLKDVISRPVWEWHSDLNI
ncbi:type IV toxin-antitoxin system AbiEi family antitoxin domain-containing protein [Corynebacterium glutamicum]|uniref:type IV toxin-antitoxin system AbiEi family antitoxin domain-containing protein n=1 Tax=Corynebacterium glutamicum TaxID=1718 RepID=UPI000AAE3C3B|nr:type IV toxin-antitoxin system AbiEi family antitoxin domain-containing protein [Corynebacterium glutamicum]